MDDSYRTRADARDVRDRQTVSDKTVEVLVNEVVKKIMRDHPQMCTGDAAVGILDGAIYLASRMPGVGWQEISSFLKTITDVIDNSTEAQIEAHYHSSTALN